MLFWKVLSISYHAIWGSGVWPGIDRFWPGDNSFKTFTNLLGSQNIFSPARVKCSVFPTAPKMLPAPLIRLCVVCFEVSVCVGMQSACYAIHCLCNVLLCFQVELDWFTEPATVAQLCRSRWPYVDVCDFVPTKAPRTLPEPWIYSDCVQNLWARCHHSTTP